MLRRSLAQQHHVASDKPVGNLGHRGPLEPPTPLACTRRRPMNTDDFALWEQEHEAHLFEPGLTFTERIERMKDLWGIG